MDHQEAHRQLFVFAQNTFVLAPQRYCHRQKKQKMGWKYKRVCLYSMFFCLFAILLFHYLMFFLFVFLCRFVCFWNKFVWQTYRINTNIETNEGSRQ